MMLSPAPTFDRKGSDNFSTSINDPEMTCHYWISVSVGDVDARRVRGCPSDKILLYLVLDYVRNNGEWRMTMARLGGK
jgi:hypothetical protein